MNDNFATELLKEVKASAKRWFIACIVITALWFATIGIFIWYISLPVEEGYSIDQQSDNRSVNVIGGDYNGSEAEIDLLQDESGEE